ncbi:PREDICTED: uncharacterized protein LOC101304058 [Fragaria vesca subsp. vesca]
MMGEQSSKEPTMNAVPTKNVPVENVVSAENLIAKNVVKEPKLQLGQEFESIEVAYYYYNDIYTKAIGFSVRMGSNKKSKVTGEIIWKQFLTSYVPRKEKQMRHMRTQEGNNRRPWKKGIAE